jgi:hypothetical protein
MFTIAGWTPCSWPVDRVTAGGYAETFMWARWGATPPALRLGWWNALRRACFRGMLAFSL